MEMIGNIPIHSISIAFLLQARRLKWNIQRWIINYNDKAHWMAQQIK